MLAKNDKIETKFIRKMFWQFMVPSVFAAMGLALANIADSLVVGIRMGDDGLAAIGLVQPIYMVYAMLYMSIGVGGAVEYAKLMGAGKKRDALRVFNMMMTLSLIVSVLFVICGIFFTKEVLMVLGTRPVDGMIYVLAHRYAKILLMGAPVFFINVPLYIFVRNDDDPKMSTIGFVIGNIVDVSLNFILVIGLDAGVIGSVVATITGQAVAMLFYLPHIFGDRYLLRIIPTKLDVKYILKILRNGFSSSNQYISQFLFITISNRILVREMGNPGVAIFDVVMNVSYVAVLFFQAAADTVQPLASTFYGEGNQKAEGQVLRMSVTCGMVSGSILLCILTVCAGAVCKLFGISGGDTMIMGTAAVQIYCIGGIAAGFSMIMSGYYQAVDMERITYMITLCRGTVFLLLYTLIFGTVNAKLFWFLFPATEFSTIVVYIIAKMSGKIGDARKHIPEERIESIMLDKNANNLAAVIENIEHFCEKFEASVKQSYYVTMVVEEICSAIMENAFTDKEKNMYILITVVSEPEGDFRLCIRDNALAFNPFDMHPKRIELDDDDDALGALGMMMVKSKAKGFYYRRYQNYNTLAIRV